MVKHNNMIQNQHFRKDWQRYVRTWFDQPAKKKKRRLLRIAKAKKMGPRPLHSLRPIVRCPTIRYNSKLRLGRGFTLDELKAAKLNPRYAQTVGISVDHRRRNKDENEMKRNVDRLLQYKEKLIVRPIGKKDRSKYNKEIRETTQILDKMVVPFVVEKVQLSYKTSSEVEKLRENGSVYTQLRKALKENKSKGRRKKRQQEKEAKKKK
ncbi:60S ribosomal protein L13 [Bonamia ostreae]|uniref:60S ribosomal protein L13 n=1 Tax=Bonamia ostreae TaxID=126728 RepID=A0ABV2AII3_9EUKA